MASSLTTFREAVQVALEAELGIPFFGGIITGPVEDRTVGCCWVAGLARWDDDALAAIVDLRARVLLRTPQQPETYKARDPDALEQAVDDLAAALRAIRASSPQVWYFSVVSFELDLEENGIEVAIQAWRDNPAS